jgi:DNA-binding SARP family transcriptional activator
MSKSKHQAPIVKLLLFNGFAAFNPRTTRQIRISSRRAQKLLAYLAMNPGQQTSRERLAKLIWPASVADGRHSLRQVLSTLLRDLKSHNGDIFAVERETIAVRKGAISVDVIEFEQLAKRGDIEVAEELCTGEFLADFKPKNEEYGAWIDSERARLALLCASVFPTLARLHDINRRGASAIRVAEKLVKFDRFREDWQRLLIELYARYQGRGAAIKYANKISAQIKRELQAEIEPDTLSLIEAVRRGELI